MGAAHEQTQLIERDDDGDDDETEQPLARGSFVLSTQKGAGGVHGSGMQPKPLEPGLGKHASSCVPGGHTPDEGIGSQTGRGPPQQGCTQY